MSDEIRIYGQLESGLIGGYVTDYSQIKNAPDPKVNTINKLTEQILQNPNDPNIPYTVAKAYDSQNNNIFIESHAKATYMSDGSTVEDTINEIKTNGGVDIDLSKYETKLEAQDKLVEAKQYTNTAIVNLVDSAPETLNTLNELAVAIKENEDVVDVLNQSISSKQDKLISGTNIKTINSQSLLGTGDISNLAKKSYVDEVIQSKIFIGTQDEYDIAYTEGKIGIGALVIILEDSENEEGSATISALLGTAILGKMLLGQK